MNKKDKNKTILTIISTSIARKPNLKLPGMMPRRACISPELRTPRR